MADANPTDFRIKLQILDSVMDCAPEKQAKELLNIAIPLLSMTQLLPIRTARRSIMRRFLARIGPDELHDCSNGKWNGDLERFAVYCPFLPKQTAQSLCAQTANKIWQGKQNLSDPSLYSFLLQDCADCFDDTSMPPLPLIEQIVSIQQQGKSNMIYAMLLHIDLLARRREYSLPHFHAVIRLVTALRITISDNSLDLEQSVVHYIKFAVNTLVRLAVCGPADALRAALTEISALQESFQTSIYKLTMVNHMKDIFLCAPSGQLQPLFSFIKHVNDDKVQTKLAWALLSRNDCDADMIFENFLESDFVTRIKHSHYNDSLSILINTTRKQRTNIINQVLEAVETQRFSPGLALLTAIKHHGDSLQQHRLAAVLDQISSDEDFYDTITATLVDGNIERCYKRVRGSLNEFYLQLNRTVQEVSWAHLHTWLVQLVLHNESPRD